jgi:hypothetical protein
MLSRSENWLDRAENLLNKETYGYTLKEVEAYVLEIKVWLTPHPSNPSPGSSSFYFLSFSLSSFSDRVSRLKKSWEFS